MHISYLDWIVIAFYLVGVVGLGCWAGLNAKRKGAAHGESAAGDYFMAAHTLKWPVIGISLFCANISSIHLVGLAADGYRVGMPVGNFEWGASFCLIILGLVFAPFYLENLG